MSPKATPRTHASKTELLRVRNIRSQRHRVPVPPQNEGARTRSSDEPSSNVSAYMSVYVHAQASATSLQRTLNLSANKYYYYYGCWRATKRGCISKFWGKFVVLQTRQNAKQGFRVSSFRSRVSGSRHRLIRFRVSGLKNLRLRLDLWSYPGARQL